MSPPSLMDLVTPDDVLQLNWQDYTQQLLTFDELKHVLAILDCYWGYEGKYRAEQAHAKWSSGLCAGDFFNLADVLKQYERFRNLVAHNILQRLRESWGGSFDVVVGSATGTTALAGAIASQCGCRHVEMVKSGDGKSQTWKEGQALLTPGSVVFHTEELTSTLSTPPRVHDGIRVAHQGVCEVEFAPVLIVVVDRRPEEEQEREPEPAIGGSSMVSMFQFPSRLYQPGPDTCPMCAVGSEPIRPREANNWARLTGKAA